MEKFYITLICKHCGKHDCLDIAKLHGYMEKAKKIGRKEGDLYGCPYGCKEKSDMHIYTLQTKEQFYNS